MKNIIYCENQWVRAMGKVVAQSQGQAMRKSIGFKSFFCKNFFLTVLLFCLGLLKTHAQQSDNYELYANIIYRVTKYINWPDDKKTGDFVIGNVGDSPLIEEMKIFTARKTVGNQSIVIKTFSSSLASYHCQILFISEDASRSLKKIALATEGTSILLMSESNGLAQKGSCINLIIVDQHLKLEINKNNIEQRNLEVASEFLALGTIVK